MDMLTLFRKTRLFCRAEAKTSFSVYYVKMCSWNKQAQENMTMNSYVYSQKHGYYMHNKGTL